MRATILTTADAVNERRVELGTFPPELRKIFPAALALIGRAEGS
jgi:hypothetical protein